MTAYLIVNFDIDDAETYKEYQKGAVRFQATSKHFGLIVNGA